MHDDIFMSSSKNIKYYKKNYNDWVKRYFYYNVVRIIENYSLSSLNSLIAVSEHVNNKLIDIYKIEERKITIIYNGILLKYDNLIKKNNNIDKENNILIVGNNLQGKGIITLFKSLNLIKEKYIDLRIVAIGNDKNQKYLEEYALKIGINDRIKFKGRKSNFYILEKMKNSLMYVMPSMREGFGITFLEAMMSKLPVIGGNVGGTKELIVDGENGFLVNSGDYKDLARKISIIIDNDKLRNEFIKNGLESVNKYSVEKMVDKTLKFYQYVQHNSNI